MPTRADSRALAAAFLAGSFEVEGLVRRGARLLGSRPRWLRPLAGRVWAAFKARSARKSHDLITFLHSDPAFLRATEEADLEIADRSVLRPVMTPTPAATGWNLPAIVTPGELVEWLGITGRELDWFADQRARSDEPSQGRLAHYHYRILSKRFGAVRLIEAPKPRLKELQRRILSGLLEHVPPHEAVHGFRTGCSVKTFAAPHVGRQAVLRVDLADFFPSIGAGRVRALFRTLGYPERVANLLAEMCTSVAPRGLWDDPELALSREQSRRYERLYWRPHLPQGAPSSPALANLCALALDRRLSALAAAAGASYTRYADDLAFSGDLEFARRVGRFRDHVAAIALEEGFDVHHRKTRVMRRGVRQRLASVVVNQHTNVLRADYDRLKAVLTNCLRHGPASQNRSSCDDFRAQLTGRVAFVEMINPQRGSRLRGLLAEIEWKEESR